jgi:hypothetical protein
MIDPVWIAPAIIVAACLGFLAGMFGERDRIRQNPVARILRDHE